MGELTHFNEQGRAKMVDVTDKAVTHRTAVAAGEIHMAPETLQKIKALNEVAGTRGQNQGRHHEKG